MLTDSVQMYNPHTHKMVYGYLTQPIQDLLDQDEQTSILTNLGTVGNSEHAQGYGDHTLWSLSKKPGFIYAKDTEVPTNFMQFILKCCNSSYDTSWIDFFNLQNKQYSGNGNYQGYSSDEHLHLSVKLNYEYKHVTLFNDYLSWLYPIKRRTNMYLIKLASNNEIWLADLIVRRLVKSEAELKAIQLKLSQQGYSALQTQIKTVTNLDEYGIVVK